MGRASRSVGIIMGSQSDWETMQHAASILERLGIGYETRIVSAHRTTDRLFDYARTPDLAPGARRADRKQSFEGHRYPALDRPNAVGNPGRNLRDRAGRCGQ